MIESVFSQYSCSAGVLPAVGAPMAILPPLADIAASVLGAMVIGAFGVLLLLMVCVLLALRRGPDDQDPLRTEAPGGARRGEHLQHLSKVLRAVRAINQLILTERNSDGLLEKSCDTLVATRGYRAAWIGTVKRNTGQLQQAARADADGDSSEQPWVAAQRAAEEVIESGEPWVSHDLGLAPASGPRQEKAARHGIRSAAIVPLRFKSETMGTLSVVSNVPEAFDMEEVGLLQEVADHLAHALATIRLEQELAEARHRLLQIEDASGQPAPCGKP